MDVPAKSGLVYEAGSWRIDSGRRELRTHGLPVALDNRTFEILEILVASAGHLVSKDELLKQVWPSVIVEENRLHAHIAAIRKAFGSDRSMLKTVHSRGYCLAGNWTAMHRHLEAKVPGCAPGPASERRLQTNLPVVLADLIGRSSTAQRLRDLTSTYRVVTLTGAGGIGKTVLAIDVARRVVADFHDGGWIVELALLSDASLVQSTVAGVLGLKLDGAELSVEDVARAIGKKNLLLVLDNCEHVIDAAARLAEAIVQQCPKVTLIATSREALGIHDECIYRVPSLDIPASDQEEPERLLKHSAVELFFSRTRAFNADFSASSANLRAIGAICRHLDGIPLAIEFAAARAATLGLDQVLSGLDDRFKLLTRGRRTALPRHQTLRATLDWSYELLADKERCLLRRLAIFVGPFTLEAATSVLADPGDTASDIAATISGLVSKSLVVLAGSASSNWMRLLETTRTYALEKLAQSGEEKQTARRHAEYFLDHFERAEAERESRSTTGWLATHGHHVDNVRSALDWAFSKDGDNTVGVALTTASLSLWTQLSWMEERKQRLDKALAAFDPAADPRRRMKLLIALGGALLATRGACPESDEAARTALEIANRLGETDYRLRALWILYTGRLSGREYRAALALAESFREIAIRPADRAIGARLTATAQHVLGDQRAASLHLKKMLKYDREPVHRSDLIRYQFDQRVVALAFNARVLWLQGFVEQALLNAEQAVREAQSVEHASSLFLALFHAACPVSLLAGEVATAEHFTRTLIDLSKSHGFSGWNVWGQCYEGVVLLRKGDMAAGLQLLRKGLTGLPEAAFHIHHTFFLAEKAAAQARTGDPRSGLVAINRALARCEHDEEHWCIAELLRIKGDILLQEPAPGVTNLAEEHFVQSLDWARQQGALSWELRTSISLAQLLRSRGKMRDAYDLLASSYARFTEGFDTADLVRAKQLMEVLRRPNTV